MTIKPQVYKAKRFNTKASIMIEALTGDGKTGLALELAYYLADEDWGKVGHVDTENRSGNLYEGNTMSSGVKCEPFLKVDLLAEDGYAPVNYMECVEALRQEGAKAVISDSITHAWQREGGILQMVNKLEANSNANKYTVWGTPEVMENKNALFEMLRNDKVHVITTVRVKEKFSIEYNEVKKKNDVVSLGEQQMMQDGMKYEPDLVLHLTRPGNKDGVPPEATVIKSRYPMLDKGETYSFTAELMKSIKAYLEDGADPEELIKMQHEEYENAIKEYCKTKKAAKMVYDTLKEQKGFANTPITEIPIHSLKEIYLEMTA